MKRGAKTVLIVVVALTALMVAGNMAFTMRDDRLTENSLFATLEPETALKQIAQAAESNGKLAGSGTGITIPARKSARLGPTQWTVSADGTVRGTAPERGLLVLLTPELRNGKVTWHCRLEPAREFLRNTCRYLRIDTGPIQ